MSTINKIKFIALIILAAGLVSLGYFYDFDINGLLADLRDTSETNPLLAACLFIALFVAVRFAFIPMLSVSLLAGYIFGPLWGAVVSVAAITLSSSLMFLLSRSLGKAYIQTLLKERFDWVRKYDKGLRKHGFLTVLFFRVVPVFPLAVINFGLGLSSTKFVDFFLATVFGVLPGVILLVNAGKYLTDWDNPGLYMYLAIYLLLVAAAFAAGYYFRKKNAKK